MADAVRVALGVGVMVWVTVFVGGRVGVRVRVAGAVVAGVSGICSVGLAVGPGVSGVGDGTPVGVSLRVPVGTGVGVGVSVAGGSVGDSAGVSVASGVTGVETSDGVRVGAGVGVADWSRAMFTAMMSAAEKSPSPLASAPGQAEPAKIAVAAAAASATSRIPSQFASPAGCARVVVGRQKSNAAIAQTTLRNLCAPVRWQVNSKLRQRRSCAHVTRTDTTVPARIRQAGTLIPRMPRVSSSVSASPPARRSAARVRSRPRCRGAGR